MKVSLPPELQPTHDMEEMMTFIGINIFIGRHRVPSMADYWSSDEAVQSRVPYESRMMS